MGAAYDPGQWHDFGTSFAAAAGALLGLAFVAISFNLDPILKLKALPDRAIETLAFFAYALAASLLIQLPGLSGVGSASARRSWPRGRRAGVQERPALAAGAGGPAQLAPHALQPRRS